MPIYEYECGKCGGRVEVLQKMSDPPLNRHQKCGGRLSRLVSAPGIQFKGTGWYVTDYARKGRSESGDKTSDSSGSESKAKTESESKKPETKT